MKEEKARKEAKFQGHEDKILDQQKEAALKIIKDTTKFEKNIELVRDDSYNAKIFQKIN